MHQQASVAVGPGAANLNSNTDRSTPNDHYNLQQAEEPDWGFRGKFKFKQKRAKWPFYNLQRAEEPDWGFRGKLKFLTNHTKQPL
jgi:hypothetical protein